MNPSATIDSGIKETKSQVKPPIVGQLEALFAIIPEDDLLASLKVYYAGRLGYTYKVIWRTYVAMVVLNLPSFAALIRTLQNNPYIAEVCGIHSYDAIPSKYAYSRFMGKFQRYRNLIEMKEIMRSLSRACYATFPRFGKSVAIDSTDLKAWSNGGKAHKADKDAGWVVKLDTQGKKKFVWGYKLHMMVDTLHEIPITVNVTQGNYADIRQATPLLSQARHMGIKFNPDYVIMDAGYSSRELRTKIKWQWHAKPIIKSPKNQERWLVEETPEWSAIYDRRTAIERVFGRMKTQRRLNNVTVRGRWKVMANSLLVVIVTQAMALASPDAPRNCVAN